MMMTSRVLSPALKETRASLMVIFPCLTVVPLGLPSMVQPLILMSTKGSNSCKIDHVRQGAEGGPQDQCQAEQGRQPELSRS